MQAPPSFRGLVIAGMRTYFSLAYLAGTFGLVLLVGNIAFAAAIIAYFVT